MIRQRGREAEVLRARRDPRLALFSCVNSHVNSLSSWPRRQSEDRACTSLLHRTPCPQATAGLSQAGLQRIRSLQACAGHEHGLASVPVLKAAPGTLQFTCHTNDLLTVSCSKVRTGCRVREQTVVHTAAREVADGAAAGALHADVSDALRQTHRRTRKAPRNYPILHQTR